MAQKGSGTENWTPSSAPIFAPMPLAEIGKHLQATVALQSELLDKWQEVNREWFARVQSEVAIASELTNKLMTARSLPDATAACQEWATRRMNLCAEDGRRLVADGQKLMEIGARLLSNGNASTSS